MSWAAAVSAASAQKRCAHLACHWAEMCVRSRAWAALDRRKFLCYKIFHNLLNEMLVILPGVMDVSLAQTSGLWCSKVNTAILRKYVFELSQIRFFLLSQHDTYPLINNFRN